MRSVFLVLSLGIAVVAAAPKSPQRIVGGSVTSIESYPSAAAMLYSWNGMTYAHNCGGAILNNRAILSAAHCFDGDATWRWRIRVGSTNANSGGFVHDTSTIIMHPDYNRYTVDTDIAILHSVTAFAFSNYVRNGNIAGPNYNVGDNQEVWAVGWGATSYQGSFSEELRHVQIWTVNQDVCKARYADTRYTITDNMLCSGWLDVGGRDQCQGDSGGPLYHNGIIVGVCSWGEECAHPKYPGVNVRVSRFTSWILSNA